MSVRRAKKTPRTRYESKAYRGYLKAAAYHSSTSMFFNFMLDVIKTSGITRKLLGLAGYDPSVSPREKDPELEKYDRRKRVYEIPSHWATEPVQFYFPEYTIPINRFFEQEPPCQSPPNLTTDSSCAPCSPRL